MKLNIGAGAHPLEGFTNLDLPDFDMTLIPWRYENNSVESINLSHVIEHVDKEAGFAVLEECYRVLEPGGVLRIATPDLDKFIKAHATGDFSELGGYKWTSLDSLAGGGDKEDRPEYRHRYLYNEASLFYTLLMLYYFTIKVVGFAEQYDNPEYRAISLYVEAVK